MTAEYVSSNGIRKEKFVVDCVGDPNWKQIGHQLALDNCFENETWLGCWWEGRFEVKAQTIVSLDTDGQVTNAKIQTE